MLQEQCDEHYIYVGGQKHSKRCVNDRMISTELKPMALIYLKACQIHPGLSLMVALFQSEILLRLCVPYSLPFALHATCDACAGC